MRTSHRGGGLSGLPVRLAVTLAMLLAAPAFAQDSTVGSPVFKLFAGGNGLWYDGQVTRMPSDFELGGNARASLSPHISGVGGVWFGTNHPYTRGSAGLRFTVTDAANPNFSIGLGIQRHFSSDITIRPEEWAPDLSLGWRPWQNLQRVYLVSQAGYGLDSQQAWVLAGARLALWQGVNK